MRLVTIFVGTLMLISVTPETRSFSVASYGVHASVSWTTKVYMIPGDPGPPVAVKSIGSATVTFGGANILPTTSSLDHFDASFDKSIVEWVNGRSDGCGAATRTAFLPSAAAAPPYVVFFAVLAQKGCAPMALVFYPQRSGRAWRYNPAPAYAPALTAIKQYAPIKLSAKFKVTAATKLKLPDISGAWDVWLTRGNLNGSRPPFFSISATAPLPTQ